MRWRMSPTGRRRSPPPPRSRRAPPPRPTIAFASTSPSLSFFSVRFSRLAGRLLLGPRGAEDVVQPVIAFVTRVLEGRLGRILGEIHRKRPRPHPGLRIVIRDRPFDLVGSDRLEPFDQTE